MKKSEIRLAVENIIGKESNVFIDKRKNGYRIKFYRFGTEMCSDEKIELIKKLPNITDCYYRNNNNPYKSHYDGLVVFTSCKPKEIHINNWSNIKVSEKNTMNIHEIRKMLEKIGEMQKELNEITNILQKYIL